MNGGYGGCSPLSQIRCWGEINAIAHIGAFDLIADPKKGRGDSDSISLAELPGAMKNLGLTDYRDGADYLENSYLSYKLNPIEDPYADQKQHEPDCSRQER